MTFLNAFAFELVQTQNVNGAVNVLVVGGAALALKHGDRSTVDIDADISYGGLITPTINKVAKGFNIPTDWINQDFVKSYSYSRKLWVNAIPYCTLQGYMNIFLVSDLDQLCMKAAAGRDKDNEDIYMLLNALIPNGFTYSAFLQEFEFLYGGTVKPKQKSLTIIKRVCKKYKVF